MSWHGIVGHDAVVENLRRRASSGRLASTFLFVGPEGIGKRTFALKFAQALLCTARPEEELDPCEQCPACQQVLALTHPDLMVISRPKDKARITLEQLIGEGAKRMQEGLVHNLGLKPFYGGRKVGIIDDADTLAAGQGEGANCLLKTLEEPPPRSVLILIGTSEQRQLITIRSRSQTIRFEPLATSQVRDLLLGTELAADAAQADALAAVSQGSLKIAAEFAAEGMLEMRTSLLRFLADSQPDNVAFAPMLAKFIDGAAKEAPPRRALLKLFASVAADFYRQLGLALVGQDAPCERELGAAVAAAAGRWNVDLEVIPDCLERTLDVAEQVDANANLNLVIDVLLDDLAQLRLVGRTTAA